MKKFFRTVLAVLFLIAQFDIRTLHAQFVPNMSLVSTPMVTLNAPVTVLTSVMTTINPLPLLSLSFEHTITTNTLTLSPEKKVYSQIRAYQYKFFLEKKKVHTGKFCYGCVDSNTAELLTVNYSDSTPDVTFTYDRLGRVKTVADGLGNRTFSYNTALQPDTESITGLYNASITRNYAASGVVGRPSGLTMGALYTQTYGYDTKGRYNATGWTVNALSGSATYTYGRCV